jgi:gliding motility-associated-like protein
VACNGANTGSANIAPVAGIPPYSYAWSNGSSGAEVTGLQAGSYSVSITDSVGCSSTISFNIQQAAAVSLDAGPTLTVADSVFVQISSTDNAMQPSYAWTPAEGLSCSNCPNPLANPQTTTTYTLTLTDANGCSSTDTVRVIVENKCGNVFVPNAFSPDTDGNNEVLYVYGNCITILEFMIFDRWGEKVFQTNDKTVGWDGKLKGVLMNENVFIYYLHATLKNGEEVTKKGNITLIHE